MAKTWRAAAISHNAGLSRKADENLRDQIHRQALAQFFDNFGFETGRFLPFEVVDLARRFSDWSPLDWIDEAGARGGEREDAVDEIQGFLNTLVARRLGFVCGAPPLVPDDWFRYHPDSFENRHGV